MTAPESSVMRALAAVLAMHPELLIEHFQGHAQLLQEEVKVLALQWRRKLLWYTTAVMLLGAGVMLLGVAAMLWLLTPPMAVWMLILTPMVFMGLGGLCMWRARMTPCAPGFSQSTAHMQADWAMLCAVQSH